MMYWFHFRIWFHLTKSWINYKIYFKWIKTVSNYYFPIQLLVCHGCILVHWNTSWALYPGRQTYLWYCQYLFIHFNIGFEWPHQEASPNIALWHPLTTKLSSLLNPDAWLDCFDLFHSPIFIWNFHLCKIIITAWLDKQAT